MPVPGGLHINEGDIIKMISEFLQNRTLNISMLSIERETGVINGLFSDDLLFLRQLILDGQWDDVIDFIQPLITIDGFNSQKFQYIILKHKYLELLCIKSEPNVMQDYEMTVDEVVKCLNSLEGICPNKEEYSNLCFLLSLPKLSDHSDYQNWNPSNARVECFKQIQPLLQSYLPIEKKDEQKNQMSSNDRLLQLVLKGILYESCVDYCQQQATGTNTGFSYTTILNDTGFSDADLSLLAWLQCIPFEVFSCPFEQRSIKVDIQPLIKPSLEASWSEQILVTPIKPKMFPHSATPSARPRSAELMTRSLNPQFDGLSRGLNQSSGRFDWSLPSATNQQLSQSIALGCGGSLPPLLSASVKDPMMMSVDNLFSQGEVIDTKSSISEDLKNSPRLAAVNSIKPASPATPRKSSQSPNRSSLIGPPPPSSSLTGGTSSSTTAASVNDSSNELYKEYQRQKQRVQEQLELQEKQREMYQNELMELERKTEESLGVGVGDNRLHEELLLSSSQSDAPSLINTTTIAKPDSARSTPTKSSPLHTAPGAMMQHTAGSTPPAPSSSIASLSSRGGGENIGPSAAKPRFIPVTSLDDGQAIRAIAFHPSGNYYAIGSNSKMLRICAFPNMANLREEHVAYETSVVYKHTKHHKGSLYCVAWNPLGDLIATGSNDKTIRIVRFNEDAMSAESEGMELSFHDGTVRDLVFMQDVSSRSSLLISGGAGDCKNYVTDCQTGAPIRAMTGHTGHIYALHTWGGCMFVSGSQDKTARFWDLRASSAITVVPSTSASAFASVCVDPSGRLMVSGHEDGTVSLYDIRGAKVVQTFQPHTGECRSARFSTNAYYLLTVAYDGRVVLTDLHGDLLRPLPSVVVGEHRDKVIQCRWHPTQFGFVTCSADKTAVCWGLPMMDMRI